MLLQALQLLLQVLCHEQLLLLRAADRPALGVVQQDDPLELQQVAVQAVCLQQPVIGFLVIIQTTCFLKSSGFQKQCFILFNSEGPVELEQVLK